MSIVINNNSALVKYTQTLYNNKTKSDFKLVFMHSSNKKEIIYVHQIILCQSRYFFNILNNTNNSESKKKEMKIAEQEREDIEVFKDMIKLAYGFSISIKHYTNLISLLILVNKYQFEEIEETIKTIVLEQFSCDNIPKENALWLWYTFGLKSDGTLTYPYDDISNGFIKSSKRSYRRLALEQIESDDNEDNEVESTPVVLVTNCNSSFSSGSNQSNQSAGISNVSFVEELERIIETNYIYNNCNDSINSEDKRSTIYGGNKSNNAAINLKELSKFIKTLNLQCFHSFIDKFITNDNPIQFSTDLLQYWISGNPKQRLTEAGTLLLKIKQSQQEQSRKSNDGNSMNNSNNSSFPSWVIKNNLVKK
ncbi:hypothetical protein ABK040_016368 [Willaertia magna]